MNRRNIPFHNRPMAFAAIGAVTAAVFGSFAPLWGQFAALAILLPITVFLFRRRNYGFMLTSFLFLVLLRILLIPFSLPKDGLILSFLTPLRNGLRDSADVLFRDEAATARGIILGDTSQLTDLQHAQFAAGGLLHLFAVSGLHVSLLTGTLGLFVRTRNRVVSITILSLFLLFFCAVTGFSSSVLRAAFMLIGIRISRMRDKQVDMPSVFCFALAFTVLLEPFSLYRAGFQLSFAAAAGMVLFSETLKTPFREFAPGSKIVSALTASIAASIGMLPVMAYHFGNLTWISIPLSILLIPVMPIILLFGFFAVLLNGLLPQVSVLLSYPAYGAIKFLTLLVESIRVPALLLPRPHPIVIVLYYVSLILCSKLYLRNAKHPPWLGLGLLAATILLWYLIP